METDKNVEQMDAFNGEHPVWSILQKEKYIEEWYKGAEALYDFIETLSKDIGPERTKQLFDCWNEFSSETFGILAHFGHPEIN